MTFDAFIAKYNGVGIDFDGAYSTQCVDLYRQYVKEVLGLAQSPGVTGAKEIFATASDALYDKIKNTPTGVPAKGDIVVWGSGIGTYGHVAIFIDGNTNYFNSFDQNFPVGTKCHVQNHNYKSVTGWLHPKSQVSTDPCIDVKNQLIGANTQLGIKDGTINELSTKLGTMETTIATLNREKDVALDLKKQADEKVLLDEEKIKELNKALNACVNSDAYDIMLDELSDTLGYLETCEILLEIKPSQSSAVEKFNEWLKKLLGR